MDDEGLELRVRLDAIERTSVDERLAHVHAEELLVLARYCGRPARELAVHPRLKSLPSLAAPLVVVLAAVVEAPAPIAEAGVFARFGRVMADVARRDSVALTVRIALDELVRRRLVHRVAGLYQAASSYQHRSFAA